MNAAANNSGGGVNLLSGRLLGMGAAAVAGADIAIPALLAIGAAAGGLLAAVGVGMLGFSGIGAALSAHNAPTTGSGGSGGGQSAQQQAIAAQQRQLQATQSTRSAQDQLTQAIQSQAAAETALHDARAQALLDLIDMDNKLRDNQLAQQQNAITLDEARRKLAVILSAPGANLPQYADQVAQAKLDVATAEQKQKELSQQGKQLSTQDAAAHKAGVEGATAVVKAKQQLVDANHKLAEAQQNVTETAEKNLPAAAAAAASLSARCRQREPVRAGHGEPQPAAAAVRRLPDLAEAAARRAQARRLAVPPRPRAGHQGRAAGPSSRCSSWSATSPRPSAASSSSGARRSGRRRVSSSSGSSRPSCPSRSPWSGRCSSISARPSRRCSSPRAR